MPPRNVKPPVLLSINKCIPPHKLPLRLFRPFELDCSAEVKVNEKETLSLFPVSGCCANAYFVTRDGAAFMVANTLPLQRDSFALTFSRMVASKTTKPRPATVDHMFAYEPRSMEVHPRLLEQTAFLQSTGGHLYEAREYWNNGSWVSLCGMLLLFVVLAVALLCFNPKRRRRRKISIRS